MAEINIKLNNKIYFIDESALVDSTNDLKLHFSGEMNGTGATINLGGATYNIDATKLSAVTDDFVSHLGTIAGSGSTVKINGVEYTIGTDKIASTIAQLETAFSDLSSSIVDDDIDSLVAMEVGLYYFQTTTYPVNETARSCFYSDASGTTKKIVLVNCMHNWYIDEMEIQHASAELSVINAWNNTDPSLSCEGIYWGEGTFIEITEDTYVTPEFKAVFLNNFYKYEG